MISKIAAQRYTGSSVKPEVTVTLNNIVLKEGSDYYLNYSDNGAPGKAAVMVVGTGNYTGSAKTSFIIKPEKPVITRLRAHGSKSVSHGCQVLPLPAMKSTAPREHMIMDTRRLRLQKMVRCSLIQGQNSPKELIITRSAAMLR